LEKILLKGLEHNSRRESKGREKLTSPVSLELLEKIWEGLKRLKIAEGSKKSVWAGCLVGFWGAFRLGELFPKKKIYFDKFADLIWEDVTWLKSGDGVHFRIKSGKIPGPPGNSAELYRIPEGKFCPIRALSKLEKYQRKAGIWGKNLPVFRRASGKNLTPGVFLKTVNKAISVEGLTGISLTGKSFRSGMLSALSTCPRDFQETHLKSLGRWKSGSYLFYSWSGPVGFRDVFCSVSKILFENFKSSQVDQRGNGPVSESLIPTAKTMTNL
jgi:hypothetical protein